jgi:hypothetical protein
LVNSPYGNPENPDREKAALGGRGKDRGSSRQRKREREREIERERKRAAAAAAAAADGWMADQGRQQTFQNKERRGNGKKEKERKK